MAGSATCNFFQGGGAKYEINANSAQSLAILIGINILKTLPTLYQLFGLYGSALMIDHCSVHNRFII